MSTFFLLQVWLALHRSSHLLLQQPLPTNLKVGKASQLKHRKRLQTLESTWKKQARKKSWGSFLHFLLMRSATKKANLFYPPTPNHHTEVASSQILIKVETLEWGRRTLKRPPSRILKILGSNTRVYSVQEELCFTNFAFLKKFFWWQKHFGFIHLEFEKGMKKRHSFYIAKFDFRHPVL